MKLKNLATAIGIGLASAGLTNLENSLRADVYVLRDGTKIAVDPNRDRPVRENYTTEDPEFFVKGKANINGLEICAENETAIFFSGESVKDYTQPYISIGNKYNDYKITLAAPRNKSVSITFPKGREYNCGIDGRFGDLTLEAKDYGWISVKRRQTEHFIPVIKSSGNFRISSGDMIKLECKDDKIQPSRAAIDFSINTPAFQLLHGENGKLIGEDNIWFCDNYGRFTLTHLVIRNEDGKNIWNYHIKSDGEDNLYFSTKAFARLEDKDSFWRNNSYKNQWCLRTADLNTLIKYTR